MPTISVNYPPPDNAEDFERLCRMLFAKHWGILDTELYGRRGHRQYGVDFYGIDSHGVLSAGQCKLHGFQGELTVDEVLSEIDKALDFEPTIGRYVIVTTAKRSPHIQSLVAERTIEHRKRGLFEIAVYSWDDVELLLQQYPSVAEAIYGGISSESSSRITRTLAEIRRRIDGFARWRPRSADDLLSLPSGDGPHTLSPATLLSPRYALVPFDESIRSHELSTLKAWCTSGPSISMRIFIAQGGSGKTRLFMEWAKGLVQDGWCAGFIPEQVSKRDIKALLASTKPVFAVVDYAECRPRLLELLRGLSRLRQDCPTLLRIALLARNAGDWWRALVQQDAEVGDLLLEYEPFRIVNVPVEGGVRKLIVKNACDVFARLLSLQVPDIDLELQHERFGNILYLHATALAALEGLPMDSSSLLQEIISREQRIWAKRYETLHETDNCERVAFGKAASQFVAAVTLIGGAKTLQQAHRLLHGVKGPDEKHFLQFLHDFYRPNCPDGVHPPYLAPLEPDMLGQSLILSVLDDAETAKDYLESVLTEATHDEMRNTFFNLGSIASHSTRASNALAELLRVDFVKRAKPAFDAAIALGSAAESSPLGRHVSAALVREGTLSLATHIDRVAPKHTVALREAKIWSWRTILSACPARRIRCPL